MTDKERIAALEAEVAAVKEQLARTHEALLAALTRPMQYVPPPGPTPQPWTPPVWPWPTCPTPTWTVSAGDALPRNSLFGPAVFGNIGAMGGRFQ